MLPVLPITRKIMRENKVAKISVVFKVSNEMPCGSELGMLVECCITLVAMSLACYHCYTISILYRSVFKEYWMNSNEFLFHSAKSVLEVVCL